MKVKGLFGWTATAVNPDRDRSMRWPVEPAPEAGVGVRRFLKLRGAPAARDHPRPKSPAETRGVAHAGGVISAVEGRGCRREGPARCVPDAGRKKSTAVWMGGEQGGEAGRCAGLPTELGPPAGY